MELTWGRQDLGGSHVSPMNFVIWGTSKMLWRPYRAKIQIEFKPKSHILINLDGVTICAYYYYRHEWERSLRGQCWTNLVGYFPIPSQRLFCLFCISNMCDIIWVATKLRWALMKAKQNIYGGHSGYLWCEMGVLSSEITDNSNFLFNSLFWLNR